MPHPAHKIIQIIYRDKKHIRRPGFLGKKASYVACMAKENTKYK